MKLGAMDFVVRGSNDLDVLLKAKALGLDGVEFNVKDAELRDPTCPRLEAIVNAKRETGMTIPSLCMGEHNHEGLIAAAGRSAEAVTEIRGAVRWCVRLEANVLLLPFFFTNEPRNSLQRDALAQTLAPLCKEAERAGVTICFEGVELASNLRQMAERIGSPSFGVYFDLANIVWVDRDGPEEIRNLGPLIKRVHMKESRIGPGDARPGLGRVDYAGSAKALKDIGYQGWIVMETPPGDAAEVARDIAFTRRFFPATP